jgi:hypothetical protein
MNGHLDRVLRPSDIVPWFICNRAVKAPAVGFSTTGGAVPALDAEAAAKKAKVSLTTVSRFATPI